jgi:hypothetical protein
MKTPLFTLALLVLISCQPAVAGDETSPYYKVPVGSTLTLHQPLTIQPNHASVHMQDGILMPASRIDNYYPSCEFEVNTLAKEHTLIRPDTFTITKVVQEHDFTTDDSVISTFNSGGDSAVDYMTVLYLKSSRQPDVLRMTCTHWDEPIDAEYLSINEMRKAMGKIFTLNISQAG